MNLYETAFLAGYEAREEEIKNDVMKERERCIAICTAIEGRYWAKYKGDPPFGYLDRGNKYDEGISDGAEMCRDAIRKGSE